MADFFHHHFCKEKKWVLLNRAPNSTQLHPPPPSSFQPPPSSIHLHPAHFNLHPAHFSLHPALCNTLNNISNNIARNWAISPNLGQKTKSCPFWLKIGTHGILEILIPNPDLDFWNSDTKIHFWANLGPKIIKCLNCLKIGTYSISRMVIPNPDLDFWNFDPKIHFWANMGQKIQGFLF